MCSTTRGCARLLQAASFVVLSAGHGEDVIPERSCATSPFSRCIHFVPSALNSREGRRLWLVAGGQSGGATVETEMKLHGGLVTLACFFFNAAKLDCRCNCNGELWRTALIGCDPFAFNAVSYCFSFGFEKKVDILVSELKQLQA